VRALFALAILVATSLTFVAATAISPAGATIAPTLTLGPLSPSTVPVEQAYDGSIIISGGVAPYTLTENTTQLQDIGLTAALHGSAIDITGTPNTPGTFSDISLSVNDSDNPSQMTTVIYTITVEETAVMIGSITALTGDTGGNTYTDQLPIAGGTSPYTLTESSGLPPGLTASLESNSILISGQPTTVGTYSSVSLTVTDSLGETGTVTGAITIVPPPGLGLSLTSSSWTVNEAGYSGSTSIDVGTSPFVFSQSGLPPGLSAALNGADDEVLFTGTPTATGTYSDVSFSITDAWGATATQTYTITISAAPSLGSLSTSSWTVNAPGYTGSIPITGGTGPFTLSAASGLPVGLTAAVSGSAVTFTGTPTASGTFSSVSVTITDVSGASATQSYTITINAGLSLGSLSTASWTVNRSGFTGSIPITDGTGPYMLHAASGLPVGLTAAVSGSAITFTGTPTASGTFSSVSLTVTDATGASATQGYTITINPAPSLDSLSTAGWTVNQPGYTGSIPITGGTGPFMLSAASGLPVGLTAVVSGSSVTFTGTPTATGTFSSVSLTVTDVAGATATQTYTITINPGPDLGSLSTASWTLNQSGYSGSIPITGGTGPFMLSAASGLPVGLTAVVSGSSVTFTGTPTATGTFSSVSLTVTDVAGATATQTYTITINPAPSLGSLSTAGWTVNQAGYPGSIPITEGTGPFTLGSVSGLPPGLSAVVNGPAIGFIGTPTASATFSAVSLTVTDAAGATATQTYPITINPAPSLGSLSTAGWTVNQPGYPGSIPITGGTGPLTLSAASGLPPGLGAVVSGSSVTFTGTPTATGTFSSASVTVADAAGATATRSYTITINPAFANVAVQMSAATTTPQVGTQDTFTLSASSAAESTVESGLVVVTDVLPAGLGYVSSSASNCSGSCASALGQTVTWTIDTLAPGASSTLQLVVDVTSSSAMANTATFTQSTPNLSGATSGTSNTVDLNPVPAPGYRLVGSDGGVFTFGGAQYDGSLPADGVQVSDIVGMTAAPGGGYWLVGSDGGVFAFGGSAYDGSLPAAGVQASDIVGMAAAPGGGYWLVGSDGGVFAFGGARYDGTLPDDGVQVSDIVGMTAAPGAGYWLVGSDGGVFAFGGAAYDGSLGGTKLNGSIVASTGS
jgi:Tfp pilus assembly major pilin PilA